jgi:hypothetical protein
MEVSLSVVDVHFSPDKFVKIPTLYQAPRQLLDPISMEETNMEKSVNL